MSLVEIDKTIMRSQNEKKVHDRGLFIKEKLFYITTIINIIKYF